MRRRSDDAVGAELRDGLGVEAELAKDLVGVFTEVRRRSFHPLASARHVDGLTEQLHRAEPRVLEARGLDVTPAIIKRLERVGDEHLVRVLERIYRDEIGHVRIGNYWFESLCKQRELEPPGTFRQLLREYQDGPLRGPFNIAARVEAGFTAAELADLETLADQPG